MSDNKGLYKFHKEFTQTLGSMTASIGRFAEESEEPDLLHWALEDVKKLSEEYDKIWNLLWEDKK